MGDYELTERCHADEDGEPFLPHKIIGTVHTGQSSNHAQHHHHRHARTFPKLFSNKHSCSPSLSTCNHRLIHLTSSYKYRLFLHLFTSVLLLASLAANLNYLWFKIKLYYSELPTALFRTPWLLLILGCECFYAMSSIISLVDYLVLPDIPKDPSTTSVFEDYDCNSDDLAASDAYPIVHIMIPCCKEPTDVPQESILAALALDYPTDRFKVFVLDDGGDDDLKAICDTMRVEHGTDRLIYLRRKKIPGVPHNFKCGNMNFGLQHSDAEYVVMMDADMILHSSFLNRTLPHIINSPNVSFVQVPQAFYNLPIGDPLNDACVFGYDRVLVHRNSVGCATCVGTGVVLRRKHLDEIGGFQPQSITEDTMTAYALFNCGYKSVYVHERLQVGLTPWTFEGFVKQRLRWGQGALQQLTATWKTMLGRGSKLNILLKFCYFWHAGYYYMSILNIILLFTLWSALAFRLDLVIGNEEENEVLLSHLAVYLLLWRVCWFALWLEVPLPIQSRNRDESQFWWMSPFFVKMVIRAAVDFKSTFTFTPTSNVDRSAAAAGEVKHCAWMKKFYELKHVQTHIAFIVISFTTVIVRAYITFIRQGGKDCREGLLVVGLSVFLLTVCVHMSVPVVHILWPTGFTPKQRKSLLHFNSQGVPVFDPAKTGPKWHNSVYCFELVTYINIGFWGLVYWAVHTHAYARYCPIRPISR